MAAQGPESPRQKMINLMYIVLMAMLALNVSSDVLKGFSLVDESLDRSTTNSTSQNNAMYEELRYYYEKNPEKVAQWYEKAMSVKMRSDSLYDYVDYLKRRIVIEVDGDDGDVDDIQNKEDLEAASYVMLAPKRGEGQKLFDSVNSYRDYIIDLVQDTVQRQIINDNLSTDVPKREDTLTKNWQEYMFENVPVAAAVTLLTKLQNDIRYAEGEVIHTLMNNIDVGDLRVNQVNAYVIPNSQTVVRGGEFKANIILAAVDSTQKPNIYVGGKLLPSENNGSYSVLCNSIGDFTLNGYMELMQGDGTMLRRDFSQPYTVIEPTATVSATMMNVLYAGYDNPLSISVPGVANSKITASIANGNGSITRSGDGYIIKPATVGKDVVIAVNAQMNDGRTQNMGEYSFRVRQLPDPTPFIEYTDKGTVQRYRGGRGLPKSVLMNTDGIIAAIDDGLLNIGFRVLGFETVFFDNMGNAVPEVSKSSSFTERQKEMFRRLSRGKRFYISRVKAIGPDGIERTLPTTLEVIVN